MFSNLRILSGLSFKKEDYGQILDRGLNELAAGKFKTANRLLSHAHDLLPSETQANANRVLALLGLGNLEIANVLANDVLNAPTGARDKGSNLILAQALEQMGRFKDAAKCVANAFEADQTEFGLLELVGRLYWKGGDHALANTAWNQWATLDRAQANLHLATDVKYLGLPWVGWIGNMCHLDIYQKALMLGLMTPHKAVILAPSNRIANACLLDYWRKYFDVQMEDDQFSKANTEFHWETPIHTLQLKDSCMYLYDLQAYVEKLWADQRRPPLMQITSEHEARGQIAAEKLGIPPGAWFVCLHIREQGFWKEGASKFHLPRSADIRQYDAAIKTILDAGGYVVRMGDPSMRPLSRRARVIDYAHSDEKSDWLDVYLAATCRFMLASNSGLIWLAKLFGRPVIGADWLPMCPLPPSRNDIFVPKRLYSKELQRHLSFSEMLEGDLSYEWSGILYDRLRLRVHDAEPEVLAHAVTQMLEETEYGAEISEASFSDSIKINNKKIGKQFLINSRLATGFKKCHPEFHQNY